MSGTMIEVIANDRLGRKGWSRLGLSPLSISFPSYLTHIVCQLVRYYSPSKVLSERHCRRPQEAHRRPDGDELQKGPAQEMVRLLPLFAWTAFDETVGLT
jgi:hypothetical protein